MVIILFGAPGSGKGTQAAMLSQNLKIRHISLGDILRVEVKANSALGQEVKGYMEKGALVPDEVVSRVIESNICADGFILDGFPRNINQAVILDQVLQKKGVTVDMVLYLEVNEQTIIERLSYRRVCKECGSLYHLKNMPPKKDNICDKCAAVLFQRPDDNPETIKKRWQVFVDETSPVLDFYKKQNKLILIDGTGNKDQIFERTKPYLAKWMSR